MSHVALGFIPLMMESYVVKEQRPAGVALKRNRPVGLSGPGQHSKDRSSIPQQRFRLMTNVMTISTCSPCIGVEQLHGLAAWPDLLLGITSCFFIWQYLIMQGLAYSK